MVQNPKYWRAKECARLQNKTQLTRKVWFFFVYISQWSLVTFLCSPVFWILNHVNSSCKGNIARWRFNTTSHTPLIMIFITRPNETCTNWSTHRRVCTELISNSFVHRTFPPITLTRSKTLFRQTTSPKSFHKWKNYFEKRYRSNTNMIVDSAVLF